MANNIQIRQYENNNLITIDNEILYPIHLATNIAINRSYDIKQYDLSMRKGWGEDGELYYIIGFSHKNHTPEQKGGEQNFQIFIRHSDYKSFFYLSR